MKSRTRAIINLLIRLAFVTVSVFVFLGRPGPQPIEQALSPDAGSDFPGLTLPASAGVHHSPVVPADADAGKSFSAVLTVFSLSLKISRPGARNGPPDRELRSILLRHAANSAEPPDRGIPHASC